MPGGHRQRHPECRTTLGVTGAPTISNAIEPGGDSTLDIGQAEGRGGTILDQDDYPQANPDVADAVGRGEFASAYDHYVAFGAGEGRDPSAYFDTSRYRDAYDDVAAAGIDPLTHYLTFGLHEGRTGFLTDDWG
jgi:hypothetical protein